MSILHALIEYAAREAECPVDRVLVYGPASPRKLVDARYAAWLIAAEAGCSREQTARAFKTTKRTVVRGVKAAREMEWRQ
jgi:AraC-like DNA-binding protein